MSLIIINQLVVDTVKLSTKFDLIITDLLNEFNESCPPANRLDIIINKKKNLEQNIIKLKKNIEILKKTTDNIEKFIDILKINVNILTSLPIPVSTPPGAGIPVGILMTYSNKLGDIKDYLSINKNLLSITNKVSTILNSSSQQAIDKIKQLDNKILNCLQSILENMSEDERMTYINNISFKEDEQNNITDNMSLNSNNPLIYKGYKIIIENKNQFLIPQYRAVAVLNNKKIVGDYSFASKLEILIEEMKIKIDNFLNSYIYEKQQ